MFLTSNQEIWFWPQRIYTQVSDLEWVHKKVHKKGFEYFRISRKMNKLDVTKKTLLKTQSHEQNYKYSLRNPQFFLTKTSQYSYGYIYAPAWRLKFGRPQPWWLETWELPVDEPLSVPNIVTASILCNQRILPLWWFGAVSYVWR